MNQRLVQIRKLIDESMGLHPGDKTRLQGIIRQLSIIIDNVLESANSDGELVDIGEVLDDLRIRQYYIFSEVMRNIKNHIKAQDALQKYRWNQVRKRLRR